MKALLVGVLLLILSIIFLVRGELESGGRTWTLIPLVTELGSPGPVESIPVIDPAKYIQIALPSLSIQKRSQIPNGDPRTMLLVALKMGPGNCCSYWGGIFDFGEEGIEKPWRWPDIARGRNPKAINNNIGGGRLPEVSYSDPKKIIRGRADYVGIYGSVMKNGGVQVRAVKSNSLDSNIRPQLAFGPVLHRFDGLLGSVSGAASVVEGPAHQSDADNGSEPFEKANPEHSACAFGHSPLGGQIFLSALLFLGGIFSGVRGFERLG